MFSFEDKCSTLVGRKINCQKLTILRKKDAPRIFSDANKILNNFPNEQVDRSLTLIGSLSAAIMLNGENLIFTIKVIKNITNTRN